MPGQKEPTIKAMQDAQERLDAILDVVTEEELKQPSSNPGWSAKDTLAHLATIEVRTRGLIDAAITGIQRTPLEDINDYNERAVSERRGRSLEQLREELIKERHETLALLQAASDADFDNELDHPRRGRITLAQLCQAGVDHLRTHGDEIAAIRN